LTAETSPVQVNWVELVMRDEQGNVTFRAAFVTNHLITKETVGALVEAGRCRWKIESAPQAHSKEVHYGLRFCA